MILSVIAFASFGMVVLLTVSDIAQQRRESERINRAIQRENIRRRNAEQDLNFRLELNREQLMREYMRWDIEGEWE